MSQCNTSRIEDEDLISYCHGKDPLVRFRQYAKDPVPDWATDIQPEP